MARLIYSVDFNAPSLEIAAQALTAARMEEFAHSKGLQAEEVPPESSTRNFILLIPAEQLEDILLELEHQGLANTGQTLIVPFSIRANLPQHILDFFTIEEE